MQAFDTYEFERMRVPQAAGSDFVLVNLFRAPIGAPMRPDAVGELLTAASRRAGLDPPIRPHQLRHACGSNLADAGGGIDVVADLLGHASVSSSKVYVHPDPARLRAAVDAVPSPREQVGTRDERRGERGGRWPVAARWRSASGAGRRLARVLATRVRRGRGEVSTSRPHGWPG